MKVAITSSGSDPRSQMDDRLGRCPYFVIYDTESETTMSLKNEATDASSGAGTKAMQVLIDNNVEVVITGKVGPNAMAVLDEAGMKAITGMTGTVEEAISSFRQGKGI